jgi:PAS domain S-box-containing protein
MRRAGQPSGPSRTTPDLQQIYDTAPIGLAFLSPDCRYLQINQRLTEICGIPVADHLGRSVRETVPALASAIESIVGAVMLTGEPVTGVEVAGQRAEAGERFWMTCWHPVRGPDGEIVGVNVAAEEITERKRAEAALRASEEQFHTLADSVPQLVWMADAGGTVFWLNRAWHDYTGHVAGAIRRDWKACLHPASLRDTVLAWNECLAAGRPMEMDVSLRDRNGQYHPFLTRVAPLRDTNGAVYRWIGTHVDISEHRRREQQIRLVVDELSHRIKNLLTVILAVAGQTAKQTGDVAQYQERFAERLRALSHCHDLLVHDNWRGASLADVVATQLKPFLENGEHRAAIDGPPLVLTPNAVQNLGLAFHELATNAAKHGALSVPQGKVSIAWRRDAAADRIAVEWRESSGPAVAPPQRCGFGRALLERIVPRALNGTAKFAYAPAGLVWTLEFPAMRGLTPEGAAGAEEVPERGGYRAVS